jgi:PAS domain S-box-containing protein
MVEAVKDYAIFMLDTDGIITTWNLGAQRLKGYSADEIIGRHFRTFYPEEQQRAKHPEYELEVAMRDGRYEEEGWRVRKDGTRLWANVVITALIDHEGKHFGFAKVTRDMTERRAAETARERNVAQLAANNEELTTAARQTEEFLAVTAHELQSPVTAINGAAEILEDYWDKLDPDERLDTLNRITASGRRIRLLLDDLLTASRLDAGKFSLSPERVSLAKVVDQALQEVKEVAGAIEVRGVDGVWVRADAGRVVQIFINLLSNAARYGASPYAVSATRNGDLVEVRVSDAGTGPSPELQTRLFQKFSKDAGSRRGTGLGLFIVRELARMQGGDAWFEQPATFAVSLPAD